MLDDADGDAAAVTLAAVVADGTSDEERLGEEVAEENADADSAGDADSDLVGEDTSDEDTLAESVRDTEADAPPTLADGLAEELGDGTSVGQIARITHSSRSET